MVSPSQRVRCRPRGVLAAPLVAALLHLLAPGPGWASEEGVLAELPFLDPLSHDGPLYPGHVRIDLSARPGRPLPMLLDTGAAGTVMTPLYARALRITVRKHKQGYYRRSTILGRNLEFHVGTRSSETGSRTGWEFGLLGANFLREYVVEVDYQRKRVRFLDPSVWSVSEETAEPGEWVLPMGMTDNRPTVEIELGSGRAHFLMDTGATMDLMLSEEKARELGIEIPATAATVIGQNVLGRDRSASFFVSEVRVGGRAVPNVSLVVTLREGSTFRTTNLAGADEALLGNTFLSRFRVRFDYPNGRVGLLPVVTPPPPEAVLAYLPDGTKSAPEAQPTEPIFVPVDLSPVRAAAEHAQEVWLEVDSPVDGSRHEDSVGWLEVRGWAGAGKPVEHDVVVVIDISGSTRFASGSDIDGDGRVGTVSHLIRQTWRSFNPARMSSDDGDTVLAAELAATRRLIERLNPGSSRVGILTFAGRARLESPVGSDRKRLQRELERLAKNFGSGATNMAAAIELATEALVVARPPDQPDRLQSILMLSDGYPTAPPDPEAAAYAAAKRAAALGIRIYTFALGLGELQPDDIFPEIAFVSGGQHVRVQAPGDIVHELSRISLTEIAGVEVENKSADVAGRATRVFPDGSFDSLLRLRPGLNEIRITALGDAGGRVTKNRNVLYLPREEVDPAELDTFQEKLRARTVETELGMKALRGGDADGELERELEVNVEED